MQFFLFFFANLLLLRLEVNKSSLFLFIFFYTYRIINNLNFAQSHPTNQQRRVDKTDPFSTTTFFPDRCHSNKTEQYFFSKTSKFQNQPHSRPKNQTTTIFPTLQTTPNTKTTRTKPKIEIGAHRKSTRAPPSTVLISHLASETRTPQTPILIRTKIHHITPCTKAKIANCQKRLRG